MTTATKHGMMVTENEELPFISHKIPWSRGFARLDYRLNTLISAAARPVGIKFCKVVSYNKVLPR